LVQNDIFGPMRRRDFWFRKSFWCKATWGLLFHVEADPTLVRRWLGEPSMRAEAVALDPSLPERIETEAPRYQGGLAHLQEAVLDALLGPTALGRRSL
jgi:hypothetical protein